MARVYKQIAIYDARITGMRNLWEPSTEYMGKAVDKPNYLASIIIKKTRANWFEEPALAGFTGSCKELYDASLTHIPFQQVMWPIKDGDVPDLGRPQADWRIGQWILTGSSTSPIEVTIIQNGVPVPLKNRAGVKPGDYVAVAGAIAVKTNDPRGIKCYINKVMFMASGEEIVVGNGVSATDLMTQARAQGLNVTGFGGGGAPQAGFGFAPPMPSPVAGPMAPAPAGFAPPPVAPPSGNGFATPGGFAPPTGFPQR